ncbi:MAG TPA: DCC1-like thiol-disulfide oxidoreductase family protein [Gemmatimonadaceae bacterium]|jgi:predicted DCC family thiol-disulfide oxidoreductase YuxK|nr:DCC1-like thiol-disulfide oxidoreductase family protein [Gemmatimonadaceae bacterium]
MNTNGALLLFDGTCGFCAESVQFVLRHEARDRSLRFASLQSATGARIREAHPELNSIDSVIWYEPGLNGRRETVLVRSNAVLHVLGYLGGIWRVLGTLGRVIPRALRDAGYDLIARHRHRLVRSGQVCLVPALDQRERFIDLSTEENVASRS